MQTINYKSSFSDMANARISLIGPDFFSYIQAIRDEIIDRGYPCSYFDERHSNSLAAKIFYRLQLTAVLSYQRDRHLSRILDQIIANRITDVFLIDVEVVTPLFVSDLRSRGIKVHLYMWDSSQNKNSFLKLLPLLNGRSSFEPNDCNRYGMTYIPLFAEKMFCSIGSDVRRNETLVFLGTLHSHRAETLSTIEDLVRNSNFKIDKLLYYHSRILYFIKCIAIPSALKYIKNIRTKGYSKREISLAYARSKGVLDIHHPGQTGLTSRTFEALRSGAWLITLNKTVLSLPRELQSRIILLDNISELKDRLIDLQKELPTLSLSADHYLSIERFTDELLSIGNLKASQK
jgi:hypothetical protein